MAKQFVDAGYDQLALINAGADPAGFFDFFGKEFVRRCANSAASF